MDFTAGDDAALGFGVEEFEAVAGFEVLEVFDGDAEFLAGLDFAGVFLEAAQAGDFAGGDLFAGAEDADGEVGADGAVIVAATGDVADAADGEDLEDFGVGVDDVAPVAEPKTVAVLVASL